MAVPIYQPSPGPGACLCQGEILTGFVRYRLDPASLGGQELSLLRVNYAYVVVLSQACDLTQEFNGRNDKKGQLPDILFCNVPTARELKDATPGMNTTIWDRVKKNKDERYHFLEKVPAECDLRGEGIPELTVDFKRYFTLPVEEVYYQLTNECRRCVLCPQYLEHLSSRFSYFMGRVALPRDHASE